MTKSKIEIQIEAAQKKIQDEQRRLKQLQHQQSEMERNGIRTEKGGYNTNTTAAWNPSTMTSSRPKPASVK